jgi:transcriptional regulator with XRE-family HTH domain
MRIEYVQIGSDFLDVIERIQQILKERGWTAYRLARESHLADTTIGNMFRRNTVPSLATLEAICSGFGITLAQFFAENEAPEITPELREVFDNWVNLTKEQKEAILIILKSMRHD